jgi:hypothetical protein
LRPTRRLRGLVGEIEPVLADPCLHVIGAAPRPRPGEDRIHSAKDTGLGRLPSREFAIKQARCTAAAVAADLITWLRLVALDGELAVAEPKRLRYRLLHTAARLVHGQRRRQLRIPHLAVGYPDQRRVQPDRRQLGSRPSGRSTPAERSSTGFCVGYRVDALTFVPGNAGYGPNLFHYLCRDAAGFSTFGTIDTGGAVSDRFGVGYCFTALTFARGNLRYGPNHS